MAQFLPFNFNPVSVSVRDESDAAYTVGTTVSNITHCLVQVSCGLDGVFTMNSETVIDRTITLRSSSGFTVAANKVFCGQGYNGVCVGGACAVLASQTMPIVAGNGVCISGGTVTGYEISLEAPFATFWITSGTVVDCDVNCTMVISEYRT